MPGRQFVGANGYRYGFNGKEKDDEIKGNGNSYDYGARIYDPRLSRWMSVDKLHAKFPGESPYSFAGNSPIVLLDNDGNVKVKCTNYIAADGKTTSVSTVDADYVEKISSPDHYDYGFRESFDVFETTTIDFRKMENGKPTTTTTTKLREHSWILEARANMLNKKLIVTNELGDASANTDDPLGQFSGNTNAVVSPNGNGGNDGKANDDTEDWQSGEIGTEKSQSENPNDPNKRTDTLGHYIYTDKKTGDTVKIRTKGTNEDLKKGSEKEKEFKQQLEPDKSQ